MTQVLYQSKQHLTCTSLLYNPSQDFWQPWQGLVTTLFWLVGGLNHTNCCHSMVAIHPAARSGSVLALVWAKFGPDIVCCVLLCDCNPHSMLYLRVANPDACQWSYGSKQHYCSCEPLSGLKPVGSRVGNTFSGLLNTVVTGNAALCLLCAH